jgi:hypothetical protein
MASQAECNALSAHRDATEPIIEALEELGGLHLHAKIANILSNPSFMPKGPVINADHYLMITNIKAGGYLGRFCDHAYPCGTEENSKALLKKSDFDVHEAFRSLGVKTLVRRVLSPGEYRENEEGLDLADKDEDEDQGAFNLDRTAKKLSGPIMRSVGGCEDGSSGEIHAEYLHDQKKIRWLHNPTTDAGNLQFGLLSAEHEDAYSYCAFIFKIPAYETRSKIIRSRRLSRNAHTNPIQCRATQQEAASNAPSPL